MPKNTMEHMIWIILYDLYNTTHIIWPILYKKVRMYMWTCWVENIMAGEMRNYVFFEWEIRSHYQLIITSYKSFNPYWTKRYSYSDYYFASFHDLNESYLEVLRLSSKEDIGGSTLECPIWQPSYVNMLSW